MPGVKLTPMQKSLRQLSASIAATEARLLQGSTLLEMFRPLFAKKLQPLRDGAAALNRSFMRADLAEIAGSTAALKAWLKSRHEMMRERERMDEAIAAIMIAPPKRKPRTK